MTDAPNVDPRETEKFTQLATYWWDTKGPMHSLHDINPLRSRFIAENANLRDRRVLDVGCGGGILAEALARLGGRVTGIDLSQDLVELAKEHARERGLEIDYRLISAEALAEQGLGTFDIVTCMEVLEHIPKPEETVAACSRLLGRGGHAFFSTIDRSLKSFVFAVIGAEYILRLLPAGSHTYGSLIRPVELRAWARQNDLAFVNAVSIAYNPFSRKFSLARRLDVNYIMHFIKK